MKLHKLIPKVAHVLLLAILINGISCKKEQKDPDKNIRPFDFLSNQNYDQLEVEIIYVDGFQPTQGALDNIKNFLQARLNKTAGINLVMHSISSPGKGVMSLEDVRDLEKSRRSHHTHDRVLTASILFLDGDYNENQANAKVLGVAYGNSSMVIFEKTVKDLSGGIGKPSTATLESTVSLHEFGHILGLTNFGTSMQTPHQDAANGAHCNNNKCLMYFQVESSTFMDELMGTGIPSLDANCLADLRANGGK